MEHATVDSSFSENVGKEYGVVQKILGKLASNIADLALRQEQEFLDAFDVHMRRMREEFKAVRDEIEEKERKLTQNEHFNKLEKECDWYRGEALQLDKKLGITKEKESSLRKKVKELEDEKRW